LRKDLIMDLASDGSRVHPLASRKVRTHYQLIDKGLTGALQRGRRGSSGHPAGRRAAGGRPLPAPSLERLAVRYPQERIAAWPPAEEVPQVISFRITVI
jgi:hypothetical protein